MADVRCPNCGKDNPVEAEKCLFCGELLSTENPIVPEDQAVIVSSNHGTPVAQDPRSRAGQAFRNIARRIRGEEVPFLGADKQTGLWDRLQKMTGRR